MATKTPTSNESSVISVTLFRSSTVDSKSLVGRTYPSSCGRTPLVG